MEPATRPESGLPGHLVGASTWSEMVAWWRGRDDLAVLTADATWSGVELLRRSAGAAELLRSLPVGQGRAVPALLTATAGAFAYVLGGAGIGRPLAPLGPRLTAREIGGCVDGLGAQVLLTEEEFEPVAREVAAERDLRVEVVSSPPERDGDLDLDPGLDALAFVLHTSGTTGLPKAVPYTQGRLAHRVRVNTGLCGFGPGSVYATASPFHHIAGFGNHAVALAAGATLVPVPRFTVDAWKGLADLGVTHALSVPTVVEMLLDADALGFDSLETLQYGGAPIHPATLRRTLAAVSGVRLVNLYGQTEGSPLTCLTAEDHRSIAAGGQDQLLGSVGRAAPGVELRVAEPDVAGIGEVHARAAHLFRTEKDGWLHSGDLGRLDDRGYLFLVGRRGDRIIRGGENVYPIEVEHVLEQHPGVREAAVIGVADQRWGEVIRAVIVPCDPNAPPDPEELRAHARAGLAGFKVPTFWSVADALPRSPNGKLLRRLVETGDAPEAG